MGMHVRRDYQDYLDFPPPVTEQTESNKATLQAHVKALVFPEVVQYPPEQLIPVSDVRAVIAAEMAGEDDIIAASTPGSGKTTTTVERIIAEHESDKKILYAAPTNKLADETYNQLSDLAHVIRYETRNQNNCSEYIACKKAMALNKSPFETVCIARCKKISGDNRCAYLSQLDDYSQGVIVCTHAAAPYVLDKIENNIDIVISDESPTNTIVTSRSFLADESILLAVGMSETTFWKKLSSSIEETSPALATTKKSTFYLQMEIGIDAEYIQEMAQGGAWEGLRRHLANLDLEAHRKACARAEAEAEAWNADLKRLNKWKLKQYKIDKKQYQKTQNKQKLAAGLAILEEFPPFEPHKPKTAELPPLQLSAMPNRMAWEKVWTSRDWMPQEGTSPLRAAGIDAADITEAILRFNSIESKYLDNDTSLENINEEEFDVFRSMLIGDKGYKAYIEAKKITTKDNEEKVITTLKVIKRKPWNVGTARVIVLDGTADKDELEAALERDLRLIKADAQLEKLHSVHLQQSLGSMMARWCAKRAEGKEKDDKQIRRMFNIATSHLKPHNKKVLLLTHHALEDHFIRIAKEIDSSREWFSTHYYGNRGINAFENCDSVVAIGTPYVSPVEFGPISIELFGEIRDDWISRQGLRELIQSIHRIRPINSPKTIIVLGRHFPYEAFGIPDIHIDLRRQGGRENLVREAIEILTPIARQLGCISQGIAAREGVFDEKNEREIEAYKTKTGERPRLCYPHKEWGSILQGIISVSGLAEMRHQHTGRRGRPETCAGTIEAFRTYHFARRIGFNPNEWIEGNGPAPRPARLKKGGS